MRAVDLDLAGDRGSVALPADRVAVLARHGRHVLGEGWFDWRRERSEDARYDEVVAWFGGRVHARALIHVAAAAGPESPDTVGDAVAYFSAPGVTPLPGYVEALHRGFALGDVAAVTGPALATALGTRAQQARARQLANGSPGFARRLLHRDGLAPRAAHVAPGVLAHLAVRLDHPATVAALGSRPADLDDLGEALALVVDAGGVVAYEPDAVVRVDLPAGFGRALGDAWRDGAGVAQLLSRCPHVVEGSNVRWVARQTLEAFRSLRRVAPGEASLHAATALGALTARGDQR